APGVLSNDTDTDGDTLTAGPVSSRPIHGAVELQPDGSFSDTPDPDFCGSDSFTYRANDGQASSNVSTVSLRVKCANRAPVANDDSFEMAANTTLTVSDCPPGL